MAAVESGPVDVVFLGFPGNKFNGAIGPALRDIVKDGIVRVVDLLFIFKGEDGTVESIELAGLGADLEPAFVEINGQLGGGLFDAEDVEDVGAKLAPGNSVAVLAIENLWAIPFIEAIRSAGGDVIDQARVPSAVVNEIREG